MLHYEQKGVTEMTSGTYTAEEIATYLRVHPYTVKRLARAGKIPGFRVGYQWRFDVKEIEEWKRNQGKPKPTKRRRVLSKVEG